MEQLTYFIAAAFVAQYIWSYYWNCYRKGYSMDMWHFSLLTSLFVIHIMLPFNRSDLNVLALGPVLLRRTQDHVTEAYLISAFGYACVLLGGSLWRFRLGLGIRETLSRWIEFPARGSYLLLNSRRLLTLHGILACCLLAAVILYYFSVEGFGFNVRGLLLVRPELRPVAQFAAFYSVLIASYCIVRVAVFKEWTLAPIVAFVVIGLLFFGERSNLASVAWLLAVGSFVRLGRRLRLAWLIGGIVSVVAISFLLDSLRHGDFSLAAVIGGFALNMFYGNSFSDTRDFALILSFWDGQLFWGKTYLAGLFAFVPRALSSFRDTWSIGVVTASLAGYSPKEHPGLRVGLFGESYLNFGFLGVVVLGLALGATLRLADMRMKQSAALRPDRDVHVFSYYLILIPVSVASNSSLASTFYTIMLILFLSWLGLYVARRQGVVL